MRKVDPRVIEVVGALVVLAILVRPMVIGRTFVGWDWYQHQWYIWHQAESIKANGLPSLFAYDRWAVFNPHFAFYGGTLYALTALPAIVLGDAGAAMVITIILAFAAAYGGWYWLARQVGIGRVVAHAPALLFVTGPYYLAIVYATGGLGEFVAVSMVGPLLASGLAVLRADRLRARPAAALATAIVLFTGSHNLTLLWGTTLLAIVVIAMLVAVPAARHLVTRAGVWRVVRIAVPAVLVNAWYLLPDIVYQSHTFIAHWDELLEGDLHHSVHTVRYGNVFSLGRASVAPTLAHFGLQLPVLGGVWVLVGLALGRARRGTSAFRVVLILLAAIVGIFIMMESPSLVWSLPKPLRDIQFPYRFEAYILLAFAGAVVGVLVIGRGRRGVWIWALVALSIYSLAGAAYQLRQVAPSTVGEWFSAQPYYTAGLAPNSWDYSSYDLPVLAVNAEMPNAIFAPADAEKGDAVSSQVAASPGTIVLTNIVSLPQLVHLEGGRFVGRADDVGAMFVELDSDATRLTASAAHPWPVVGGWILTLLGVAGLAVNGVAIVRRR